MNNIIRKSIRIVATPDKIWSIFTVPEVTKQMGGEYLSGWKPGNAINWRSANGSILTHGTILEIQDQRLLRHNLADLNDHNKILSEISYELLTDGNETLLNAEEKLMYETTDEQYADTSAGWDAALNALKNIAERL